MAESSIDDLVYYYRCMVIDRSALPEECEQQAHQHAKIGKQAALASSRVSDLDARAKRLFAEKSRTVRAQLQSKRKTDRVTAVEVKAIVEGDPGYQTALEEKAAAQQRADEWEALKEASHGRGFMVQKLCDLWIAGLLSTTGERPSRAAARALGQNYAGERVDGGYIEAKSAIAGSRPDDLDAFLHNNGGDSRTQHTRETL